MDVDFLTRLWGDADTLPENAHASTLGQACSRTAGASLPATVVSISTADISEVVVSLVVSTNHPTNFDKCDPGYFALENPTSSVVPVIDTPRHGHGKVHGNGMLPKLLFIVKARFVSAIAECISVSKFFILVDANPPTNRAKIK
ncbi:60S ribosomal protein L28 [Mycena venus]|uniref:60S ribosomal protein L28 n=1 Tax=Mycena venus TaxID=2733690 RepID=A0A8H6U3X2_9AGAR|nr:60S ribosomal protein L28 [Mycena venus]